MAMTPLAFFNEDLENPSILASHDGVNWVVPNGLKNPIDRAGGSYYHSDPSLLIVDDVMYCFYRLSIRGGATIPRYRTSVDGVHWSPLTIIDTEDSWTSMAIRYHAGEWHCFYMYTGSGGRKVGHRTAPDPSGPWSPPVLGELHGIPVNRDIWHLDVVRHGGKWLMAASDSYATQTGSDGQILLGSSTDGTAWTCGPHVMGHRESGSWDSDMLYRPSFYIDGDVAHLYYGGVEATSPKSSWWIGKTELPIKLWPAPRT